MKAISFVISVAPTWNRARRAVATECLAPIPAPALDDAQLVARLAAREPDALALAYDRYAPALFRQISAILGSGADAEDALQETFVALSLARVAHVRDLRAYLLGAARHQALNALRRRKRESRFETFDDLESLDLKAAPENGETPHDFAALMGRLPLEQREVIALKVWEELTFAEIAEIVKISPNTAQSRYRYGIEKLRAWCAEASDD